MTTFETTDGPGALDPRIGRYLRDRQPDGADNGADNRSDNATVIALTGDASDRRYFRVIRADGGSTVLALHPGSIELASLPFANVAALLREVPLPAPEILGHSDPLGIVELEDLGDVTLQAHLSGATPEERAALYRRAIAFLEQLQRRGAEIERADYLPYRLAFDVEKLGWELAFFLEHFVEGYRAAPVSSSQRTALREEFDAIAAELANDPRVLCHRDYHSRNLMRHAGDLYVIDFQDARLGPDTYDLVSLLRDSYVELEDREVDALIAHFLAIKGAGTSPAPEFRRRFDLMALQRNLKALGTFGYQTITRRNAAYTQYMPRTLRYARANLVKYPRFARLGQLLGDLVEELR